jgi:hypothetical protein
MEVSGRSQRMGFRRQSLRSIWLRSTEEHLSRKQGIPAVIRHHPPLADWHLLRSPPDSRAERQLSMALDIVPAHYDHSLVRVCLERCMTVVTAAEDDERWNTWWNLDRVGA